MSNNIKSSREINNIPPAKQMLIDHENQIIYYSQSALRCAKSMADSKCLNHEARNYLDNISDNLAAIMSSCKTFIELLNFTN